MSGSPAKLGAIKERERFRNECRVTRKFQYRVRYTATCPGQVRVRAITAEYAACALVMILAPQNQPALLNGRDIHKTAEVFPGIGGDSPVICHHSYQVLD